MIVTDQEFSLLLDALAAGKPNPKWATCDALDGRRLARWIKKTNGTRGLYKVRSYYRWEAGGDASVWAADAALTALGLHIREIPDDVWLEKGNDA